MNAKLCIEGIDLKIIQIKRSWRRKPYVVIKDLEGTTYAMAAGDTLSLTVSMDAKGDVPEVKVGGQWRIPRAQLKRHLAGERRNP